MELQTYIAMSNHYHLHCRPEDPGQLSDFMELFNSKLAREIGRLHDWRDKVWSRRFQPIPISDEPAAQIARLKYILSHGVKEGLVASPLDWPGAHCAGPLLTGRSPQGLWYNRTLEFEANRRGLEFGVKDFASVETVTLSPLPCWAHLSPEEYRRRIADLVAEIEREGRALAVETGREPRGAAWVCRQDPHRGPNRGKRSPAPMVHAASQAVRRALREAFRIFLAAYRGASERFCAGEFDVEFPSHCFPPPRPFSRGSPLVSE
jgi:hypothetical protein